MDAFLYWFSLPLLALGGLGVVFARQPLVAARALALVLAALAGLFLSLHADALAIGALILAVRGWSGLRRFLARVPLPAEEGMLLRPFGFLCGLFVAFFFAVVFWRAVRGMSGVLPAEVSTALDGSYVLPLEVAGWLCVMAGVAAVWLGRKEAR